MGRLPGWKQFAAWAAVTVLGLAAYAPTLAQPPGGRAPPAVTPPAPPTGDPSTIRPAPAFTDKDLTAPPTDGWLTNGGNVFNQRYSPLDQINRSSVARLKGLWRTGMASGMRQDHSGQAQILVYGDTLYVINGANDVFAMDVDSGKILWNYQGKPDSRAGAPAGHSSRGVAIGDGKVFIGTLDCRLIALDQKTGKEVWSTQAETWQTGFAITSAPLYYDGMVITGFNGGEMGIRGRVKAFDAKTGKLIWTFNTIPGPGEFGHDTWPANSDAWKHGGGGVWMTPAIDPELGLIYFATSNPGPDQNGAVRAGDNLFTASVMAIEARTGKYRWHYQEVHHDLWDYDAANPVVLFDAPYKGVMRKGIVQVGKTGFTYILDRITGKPLIGIPEKAVPQEPRQATARTQPYPIGDAFVPQDIPITPDGARLEPGANHIPNYGRIFTPFWTEPTIMKPGSNGGANWPPSSYDPATHILYECGTDRASVYRAEADLAAPAEGRPYMGGGFSQGQTLDGGILAAVDLTTNKLVWRQEWREICFSGSVVTGGGLLFTGRADGRLMALDKATGEKLWEFMTDAGVNTTVTTFMHRGRQMVVVHAGGGTFSGGKRGDGVWAFSLDGTIPTLAPAAQSRGPAPSGPPAAAASPPRPVDLANGEILYKQGCLVCHGEEGSGGHGGGPSLLALPADYIAATAASGKGAAMPMFREVYSSDQLRDIAGYVATTLAAKKK
jgi:alcohol dehydrogenase (cytochrome c)